MGVLTLIEVVVDVEALLGTLVLTDVDTLVVVDVDTLNEMDVDILVLALE